MFDKTSMMVLGMAGAFALGLAVGPQLDANRVAAPTPIAAAALAAPPAAPVNTAAHAAVPRLERVLPATAKSVQQHVQGLLNDGADVRVAAAGFPNARELMTVAHAARNTDIPFILLKHRVLAEQMSLARAIHASKPELNEVAEVNRARAEAKADLARISS
jgi:hypothetical protein